MAGKSSKDALQAVVPPVIDVHVPGEDVVVEMGGEPWRLVSVRKDPPLAVLVRLSTGAMAKPRRQP